MLTVDIKVLSEASCMIRLSSALLISVGDGASYVCVKSVRNVAIVDVLLVKLSS